MATITELEVGISPVLREEYSALVREMDEINRELKMADQCLALLNKMESIGKLPTDKAELKIKAIRTKLIYGQSASHKSQDHGTSCQVYTEQNKY